MLGILSAIQPSAITFDGPYLGGLLPVAGPLDEGLHGWALAGVVEHADRAVLEGDGQVGLGVRTVHRHDLRYMKSGVRVRVRAGAVRAVRGDEGG